MGIGINKVFRRNGFLKDDLSYARSIHKWLNVTPDTKVILVGCAEDRVLERVWAVSRRTGIFSKLASLGFSAITGFDFSIYFDETRLEHMINLKRSILTVRAAADCGLAGIPHVYWGGDRDLDRLAEWVNHNPSIYALAFNMQTYKDALLWRDRLKGIEYLIRALRREVQCVFIGVTKAKRLRQLDHLAEEGCFTSARPHALAVNYRQMVGDGDELHDGGARCEDLFRSNVKHWISNCSGTKAVSA